MNDLTSQDLIKILKKLLKEASTTLRPDVIKALNNAKNNETDENGKKVLDMLTENVEIAKNENKPVCQDTGYVDFYFHWPASLPLIKDLQSIADDAVRQTYEEESYRFSIVSDPLFERKNTADNTPANITVLPSKYEELKITAMIKGGGSDNSSAVFMLNPSSSEKDIVDTVVAHVKKSGAKSCPPLLIGIGLGSSFDKVAQLSKKALIRPLSERNANKKYAQLERTILEEINALGIGPSDLGGEATALNVSIEHMPCHMATLPLAINLNCYALRCAQTVLGGPK